MFFIKVKVIDLDLDPDDLEKIRAQRESFNNNIFSFLYV